MYPGLVRVDTKFQDAYEVADRVLDWIQNYCDSFEDLPSGFVRFDEFSVADENGGLRYTFWELVSLDENRLSRLAYIYVFVDDNALYVQENEYDCILYAINSIVCEMAGDQV